MKDNFNFNKARLRFIFLVVVFVFLIVASLYFHSQGYRFKDIEKMSNIPGFPLIFILLYATVSFIPLPFAPTSFLGGLLFPFYQAVFYTLLGSLLFATLMFYFARILGRDYVQYLIDKNKKFKRIELRLEQHAFFEIFMLRLFFIIPSEFINAVAGLSNIEFKDYILATVIANTITLIFSVGLVRGQITGDMFSLVGSVIGLIVCLAIPIIFVSGINNFFKKNFLFFKTLRK
jgi:uncharacterized membrane protein YdjX (TVP38/TMEM64 family)